LFSARKIVGFCSDVFFILQGQCRQLQNLLFCICFWLFKAAIDVKFLNKFLVSGLFPSLFLEAILREDAIVYVLSVFCNLIDTLAF